MHSNQKILMINNNKIIYDRNQNELFLSKIWNNFRLNRQIESISWSNLPTSKFKVSVHIFNVLYIIKKAKHYK